jgi:hypothetical protein
MNINRKIVKKYGMYILDKYKYMSVSDKNVNEHIRFTKFVEGKVNLIDDSEEADEELLQRLENVKWMMKRDAERFGAELYIKEFNQFNRDNKVANLTRGDKINNVLKEK